MFKSMLHDSESAKTWLTYWLVDSGRLKKYSRQTRQIGKRLKYGKFWAKKNWVSDESVASLGKYLVSLESPEFDWRVLLFLVWLVKTHESLASHASLVQIFSIYVGLLGSGYLPSTQGSNKWINWSIFYLIFKIHVYELSFLLHYQSLNYASIRVSLTLQSTSPL